MTLKEPWTVKTLPPPFQAMPKLQCYFPSLSSLPSTSRGVYPATPVAPPPLAAFIQGDTVSAATSKKVRLGWTGQGFSPNLYRVQCITCNTGFWVSTVSHGFWYHKFVGSVSPPISHGLRTTCFKGWEGFAQSSRHLSYHWLGSSLFPRSYLMLQLRQSSVISHLRQMSSSAEATSNT